MEKLIERFRDIINTSVYASCTVGKNDWQTEDINRGKERCAEFCKEISIEFVKYLMGTPVREQRSATKFKEYIPKEFDLVKGLLLTDGDVIFNEFIEKYTKI